MPRFPRSYLKTSFFHVMTQGINKNYIFEHTDDIKLYIKTMYNLSNELGLKVIAYCIMNNHAHILIETNDISKLSKYMQRLNTKFGKYYNEKYERVGYVFRDRYKSEGIYCEEQLYKCIKYIYDNPVKAGICNTPGAYPYSNYKKFNINSESDYSFIDVEEDNKFNCKIIINNFLKENNIDLKKLIENKVKLKELIILLKNNYKISLRKISEELNLNRELVRRLYNN